LKIILTYHFSMTLRHFSLFDEIGQKVRITNPFQTWKLLPLFFQLFINPQISYTHIPYLIIRLNVIYT
jgi:hypothetical protein